MGRQYIKEPIVKRGIQVSETFWTFLRNKRIGYEPLYEVADRMLWEYQQKDIAPIVEQFEQCKKNYAAMQKDLRLAQDELDRYKKSHEQLRFTLSGVNN